ncbi:metallophosphoesterase family protein [Motilibacter aurantiacus]|uniref:metallophosphoesterase family protein n=1 Tax=Motilibacter aurantiacus TaxID=2714955 RepID=UPI002F2B1A5A
MTANSPLPASGDPSLVSRRTVLAGSAGLVAGAALTVSGASEASAARRAYSTDGPALLCEPYQLDPSWSDVNIVWHTATEGDEHFVLFGDAVADMTAAEAVAAVTGKAASGDGWRRKSADTHRLSQTAEDAASRAPQAYTRLTPRPVFRHCGRVIGLERGVRTPYRVVSLHSDGRATVSAAYTAEAKARRGDAVKLLLTSDHQLKNMTPANLTKVAETVGVELDGVLVAGDLVNVPDRASEWFDSTTGLAFFAGLTGRARFTLGGKQYTGAPLIQNTPLYPAIGNHEVMGRTVEATLDAQFNDPHPRSVAERRFATEGSGDREAWVTANSWNATTYEEMFPFPASKQGGPQYWSTTIGDVFLVSLFVTQIWRSGSTAPNVKGKFQEASSTLADPTKWGYGQHIFEPVSKGSEQYEWLEKQLSSKEARKAKVRVVMYHHPGHGLGDNSAPAFTDPVPTVTRDASGNVTSVKYEYPLEDDHILRDLEPLFSRYGVNLVHNGHSHLWNRFVNASGVNWLETSNVGNSYGAYDDFNGTKRALPDDGENVLLGDPGGLEPVVPTVAPLTDAQGRPMPYVSSNDITCFSVLDTADMVVRSYRYDTRDAAAPTVLFDEMPLG